jgi:hypothetical protein
MLKSIQTFCLLAVLVACGPSPAPGDKAASLSPGASQADAFIALDCAGLARNAHINEQTICAHPELQQLDAATAGVFATLAAAQTPSPIASGLKSTWGYYLVRRGGCAGGAPKTDAERVICLQDAMRKTAAAMTHVQRMRYGPAYTDKVGLEICPPDAVGEAKADCFKLVEKNWDALRLLTAPLAMEKVRASGAPEAIKMAWEEANGWLAYDLGQCGADAPRDPEERAAHHACRARASAKHYARLLAIISSP